MSRGPLTTAELRAYGARLIDLEKRLGGKVTQLEAEALRPTTAGGPDEAPAHEAEPAVRVAEDAVALIVLGAEESILTEVRDALGRLQTGTFGKCERCGHAITRVRLDAIPYARHCIRCARVPGGEETGSPAGASPA